MSRKRSKYTDGRKLINDIIGWKKSKLNPIILKRVSIILKDTQQTNNQLFVMATMKDIESFESELLTLLRCSKSGFLPRRDYALENIVRLGQELLRKKYFRILMTNNPDIQFSNSAEFIVEAGSESIHFLGRAPAGPKYPYLIFGQKYKKFKAEDLGIEILSSGSFPDVNNKYLQNFLKKNNYDMGFENVIKAVITSPRAQALRQAIQNGMEINPLELPIYLRFMLDLELMRLGQATTPGTLDMLLESHYRGALICDHSTNVSEQVQLIYDEDKWRNSFKPRMDLSLRKSAQELAFRLNEQLFRHKDQSIISRNIEANALINITEIEESKISGFFKHLFKVLDNGKKGKNGFRAWDRRYHSVSPILWIDQLTIECVNNDAGIMKFLSRITQNLSKVGIKVLFIISKKVFPRAGLSKYFHDSENIERITTISTMNGIELKDGMLLDMIATSNKAIEAAAGALQSGQGSIKIGLFGLTIGEMIEFISLVKLGIEEKRKDYENRHLIFTGLIDELLIDDRKSIMKSIEDPVKKSLAFIDVMEATDHNILLIDTKFKGPNDKKLINEIKRPGHYDYSDLKRVVRFAHKKNVDLWIAGSLTEEQIYECSKMKPNERPSLICIGGAERSFGGLRLDASQTIKSDSDPKGAAILSYHTDIKLFLSRENKLARDAGLIVNKLYTNNRVSEAKEYEKLRSKYIRVRETLIIQSQSTLDDRKIIRENIDEVLRNVEKDTRIREELEEFMSIRNEFYSKSVKYFKELILGKRK